MGFVWDQAFIYMNHIVLLLIAFYKLLISFFFCWFLMQRDNEDEELCSVFVPTNHLYIGDILLVNSNEIIRPNLSIREGIGMSAVYVALITAYECWTFFYYLWTYIFICFYLHFWAILQRSLFLGVWQCHKQFLLWKGFLDRMTESLWIE